MTNKNNSGIWGRSSELGHKGLMLIPFFDDREYWVLCDSLLADGEMAEAVMLRDRDCVESTLCLMTVRPDNEDDMREDVKAALYQCGGYYSITKFNSQGFRHLWLHNPDQAPRDLLAIVDCSKELAIKHRYSLHVLNTNQHWAVLGS